MVDSPRELVRQTLAFDAPQRVPRQLWLLPWAAKRYPERVAAIQKRFPDDIVGSQPFHRKPPPVIGDRYAAGRHVDEWGCEFENIQEGAIGQVKAPLLEDWKNLEKVRVPEDCLSVDVDRVNEFRRGTDRFVLSCCCPRPFERLQFIRGTENVFFDLMDQPEELEILIKRIHAFYVRELELWAKTRVDGLNIMDDWGTQSALLVSPDIWRRLFKPLYRDYIEIAHGAGKPLFMHTDGYVLDILPDLVELGLDAINCQVACMGAGILGERFGGKITFWGEPDRQQLLPQGTRDDVFEAVREMKASLYRKGGVIAQCEFGLAAKPDNIAAFFEAWERV